MGIKTSSRVARRCFDHRGPAGTLALEWGLFQMGWFWVWARIEYGFIEYRRFLGGPEGPEPALGFSGKKNPDCPPKKLESHVDMSR